MTQPTLAEIASLATLAGPAFAPPESARLLEAIAFTAKELFGAAACSIGLLTDDEEEIVFTTAIGAGSEGFVGTRISSGTGIAGFVASSGQPMALSNLREERVFARDVAEDSGYVPDEILAVPIATDERVLGVLELLDRDTARVDAEHDMRLLTLFANQAALAIQAARVFSHLGQSLLDAATRVAPDISLPEAIVTPADDETLTDLADVMALLSDLRRMGSRERAMAIRVLRAVLDTGSDAGRRDKRHG
jgi:GAF domain-containing protein